MGLMKALASLVGSCMVIAVASKRSFKFDDINIGDVVMRGVDWQWGDQDGGEGETGVVVEITRWKGEPNREKYGVRVVWLNGNNNMYRYGAENATDLKVVGQVNTDSAVKMREQVMRRSETAEPEHEQLDSFEKSALQELYQSLGGADWATNVGWTSDSDPCTQKDWVGVLCEDRHVVALDLSNNDLRGRLSLTISKFGHLKSLNLAHNQLTGPLPMEIGYLQRLEFLALHQNRLGSYLPETMGMLKSLKWLSLYNNNLEGHLPKSFNHLHALEYISLNGNSFSGSLPDFEDFPNLQTLLVQDNMFSGVVTTEMRERVARFKWSNNNLRPEINRHRKKKGSGSKEL